MNILRVSFLVMISLLWQLVCADLVLVEETRTDYVILLSDKPEAAERKAAQELQTYLSLTTGATLPIQCKPSSSGRHICIGRSVPDQSLLSRLQPEELLLRTSGDDLWLTGGSGRATLYAVYEFLERYLGVDFWSPDEVSYSRKRRLSLPSLDYRSAPAFENREIYSTAVRRHPEFAVRMRCNGNSTKLPTSWGGYKRWLGGCHTFDQLVPASQYLRSHPEWFSLVNGRRVGGQGRGQLCLSNPDVLDMVIKRAAEWLRAHPDAYAISISQNDNQNYCRCPSCTSLMETTGSPSGVLIWFVNQVASALQGTFPKVLVSTLAYDWSRRAPMNVQAHPNVMIRLCSIEADFSRPLESVRNADFMRNLEGWSRVTKRLAIWTYTTNFSNHLLVHPTIHNFASDIRLFARHSVTSVFVQGDSATGGMDDLSEFRTWLLSKLLWNPLSDVESLTEHFLNGFYGPSAPVVRRYLECMRKYGLGSHRMQTCYEMTCDSFLGFDDIMEMIAFVDEGLSSLPVDSVYRRRLERLRNNLRVTWLSCSDLAKWSGRRARLKIPQTVIRQELGDLARFLSANKVTKYSEHQASSGLLGYLAASTGINDAKAKLPRNLQGLSPENFAFFPATSCQLYKRGVFAFVERDDMSSLGHSVRLDTVHREWAVSLPLPASIKHVDHPWDVYVRVRCHGKGSGLIFHGGSYSPSLGLKDGLQERQFTVEDLNGETYVVVKLGTFMFADDAYVYLAPDINGAAKSIWFDYVLLVKNTQCNHGERKP